MAKRLRDPNQNPTHDANTYVAVADLHGHRDHLDALIAYLDDHHPEAVVVSLGDYCDNGSSIPALLDRLIVLKAERGDRFQPIMGNHDLACLQTLGWPGTEPDERWFRQWRSYWNGTSSGTPAQYDARNAAELAKKMPARHRTFLEGLPWFVDTGTFLFVHAGLECGPLDPQLEPLARKELPKQHLFTPQPLRDKKLATVSDASWDRVVVSAHTRSPGRRAGQRSPHFVGPNRICLSGDVDDTDRLAAVVLPSRRLVTIRPDLNVTEEPLDG